MGEPKAENSFNFVQKSAGKVGEGRGRKPNTIVTLL